MIEIWILFDLNHGHIVDAELSRVGDYGIATDGRALLARGILTVVGDRHASGATPFTLVEALLQLMIFALRVSRKTKSSV